ncbi:MAG: MoxR family ATPase [Lachnospiraceae bacterium]|nr:MoxR family ATPase [Lachnospiraceae bacterium]
MTWLEMAEEAGLSDPLIQGLKEFHKNYDSSEDEKLKERIPEPVYIYYGKEVWTRAAAALLSGRNLLLTGPKATGKNVLADCLTYVFGRPQWNVSFHSNVDAAYLIGTDTYDGEKVVFRPGPIYECAKKGGFAVLDEVNMAKNEALAVLHSTLDFRRVIDVPGYDRITVDPAARFIGTMNYGYAGTRELNEALVSRFAVLKMPLIRQEDLDRLILRSFPDINPDIKNQFMELFYELQKKAENAEVSERSVDLRGLLDSLLLVKNGLTTGEALEMTIVDKSFDPFEENVIRDLIKGRIPGDLTSKEVFS